MSSCHIRVRFKKNRVAHTPPFSGRGIVSEIRRQDIDAAVRSVHAGSFGVRAGCHRHSEAHVRPAARREDPVFVFV